MPPAVVPVPARSRGLDRFVNALTLKRVLITLALAALTAAALNPLFITPFTVLLGRLLVIALVLLLVFTAAGSWPGTARS